ncbi:response regulator [Amycolatopsis nigrescens]|uniref:response regulator n=1 Tax=Amycolatopsis nigrescens TaxID=381445 RepID=UPI0003798318|nr:response regulator [Amycolatopsis nigrescens]
MNGENQDQADGFGSTAIGLAKNPLGIIALFIVLVYGFASLVTVFASSLERPERAPLIWFLVLFPVLVLGSFTWLVSRHSGKLYAPADFQNEDNWLKSQLQVAVSLGAIAHDGTEKPAPDVDEIVDLVRRLPTRSKSSTEVLWVDDHPENNFYERRAFADIGIGITVAMSTDEALEAIGRRKFAAIISDMHRPEGSEAGHDLLARLRQDGDRTPFIIYGGAPRASQKTIALGGQGHTRNAAKLMNMVVDVTGRRG